jgi:hypothetical protein
LLHDFSLQDQVSNLWQWQLDPIHDYSASGAYQLLTTQQNITLVAAEDLIWHKLNKCLWKCLFSPGDYWEIGCQQNQLGSAWHHYSSSSFLCVRQWWCRISSAFILLLQFFGLSLVVSTVVDWFLVSGPTNFIWPFYPVYLFIMWSSGATIFSTTHLTPMCVGCVEWKKSAAF